MLKSITKLAFTAFLLISTQSFAQKTFNTAKLDSLVNLYNDNDKAMFSLSINDGARNVYAGAVGFIDKDAREKANKDTHYRIGSITKMFTSVMILQLAEEKKLSLGTTLSKFYPAVPNASKITVQQLLQHESGLFNVTDDSTYLLWNSKPVSTKEMLTKIEKIKPLFKPGDSQDYSNTNYILLGLIIEKLDKQTYAQSLHKRICEKAGLKNTYVGSATNNAKNEAYSFAYTNGYWQVSLPETDMSVPLGAGSIVSTPGDINKFLYALFQQQLIGQSSLDNMLKIKDNMGLGIMRYPYNTEWVWGHTGGIDDFVSMAIYKPADSLSVSICANGMNTSMNAILLSVLKVIYQPGEALPAITKIKAIRLNEADLPKYTGIFTSKDVPISLTISTENAGLMAQGSGQPKFPLTPTSETSFSFELAKLEISFLGLENNKYTKLELKQGGRTFMFDLQQ